MKLESILKICAPASAAVFAGYLGLAQPACAGEPAQQPMSEEEQQKKAKNDLYDFMFSGKAKTSTKADTSAKAQEAKPSKAPVKKETPKEEKPAKEEPKKPAGLKTSPKYEYSLRAAGTDGKDVDSMTEEVKVRNLTNRDDLRFEAGARGVQQTDAVKKEGAVFGSVYKTFDGCGAGVDATLGNKEQRGSVSGHVDPVKDVRVSGYVGGGRRTDETTADPYDITTEAKSNDVRAGASVKAKITPDATITVGTAFVKTNTNVDISGQVLGQPVSADEKVESKIYSNYLVLALQNPDKNSNLTGGYIGAIYTRNENTSSKNPEDDVIFIGGVSYRLTKRFSTLLTGKVGDQNGGGVKFIYGPDVDKLKNLYEKMGQLPDTECEDYKKTAKEIELVQREISTVVLGLEGSQDADTKTNRIGAELSQTFARGFNWSVGASRIYDKSTSSNEYSAAVGYNDADFSVKLKGAVTKGDVKDKRAEIIFSIKK